MRDRNIRVNVSVTLGLGKRLIVIDDRVVGECDGVSFNIADASYEEIRELLKAREVKLVKPDEEKSGND